MSSPDSINLDSPEDRSQIGKTSVEKSGDTDGHQENPPKGFQKIMADMNLFNWLLVAALFLITLATVYLFIGMGRYGYFWEQPWQIQ